jgi:hypothetical protein
MGSFNTGCGISNLSVDLGDEIAVTLMFPANYFLLSGKLKKNWAEEIERNGMSCTDHYIPYTAPVYGTYDGYGGIENIEKSLTTGMLEKEFGIPIETILSIIGNYNTGFYSSMSPLVDNMMDSEAQQLLETYRNHTIGEMTANELKTVFAAFGFLNTETNSEGLGFMFGIRNGTHMRLTRNGSGFKAFITCSGTSRKEIQIYSFADLFKKVYDHTGFLAGYKGKEEEVVKLSLLTRMTVLAGVHEKMYSYGKENGWNTGIKENDWVHMLHISDKISALENSEHSDNIVERYRLQDQLFNSNIGTLLRNSLKWDYTHTATFLNSFNGQGYAELTDLLALHETMRQVNRYYLPGFTGEQYGSQEASEALTKFTAKTLKARRKANDF